MCNQRIVRTQPIWLGETLLTHHVFTCREFSWTDIPGLSFHPYSDSQGEARFTSVCMRQGTLGSALSYALASAEEIPML